MQHVGSIDPGLGSALNPTEAKVVKNGSSLVSTLDEYLGGQTRLVKLVKLVESEDFSPEFKRTFNLPVLNQLVKNGTAVQAALNAAIKKGQEGDLIQVRQDDLDAIRNVVPEEEIDVDAVVSVSSAPDQEIALEEESAPDGPIIVVVDDDSPAASLDESKTESDLGKAIVAEIDSISTKDVSENGTPEIVGTDGAVRPVAGGFFGSLIKKGLDIATDFIPGGGAIKTAAKLAGNLIGRPSRDEVQNGQPNVRYVPPVDDEMAVRYASAPAPYVQSRADIAPGLSKDDLRDMYQTDLRKPELFKSCPAQIRYRDSRGGPGLVEDDMMPEAIKESLLASRLAKLEATGLDPSSTIPFIMPLDPGVEVISSPVRPEARLPLLQVAFANSVVMKSVRNFRTQIKSGEKGNTDLVLKITDNDPFPANPISMQAPFIVVSFGLSHLKTVKSAIVKFQLSIPQGSSLDGALEGQYGATIGYRILETSEIIIRMAGDDDRRMARIAIFPWTYEDAIVGYQPLYIRTDGNASEHADGFDKLELTVKSAPQDTYVTLTVPGVDDSSVEEIKNAIFATMQ